MPKKKQDKTDIILNKLEEHDIKFDKVFAKFSDHDKKFDKVFAKLSDHDKRFDEVTTTLDKIVGELERAREDRVFARAKDKEQDQKIDNLDQRVKVLEESRA